jgi:hypothetical protein
VAAAHDCASLEIRGGSSGKSRSTNDLRSRADDVGRGSPTSCGTSADAR